MRYTTLQESECRSAGNHDTHTHTLALNCIPPTFAHFANIYNSSNISPLPSHSQASMHSMMHYTTIKQTECRFAGNHDTHMS